MNDSSSWVLVLHAGLFLLGFACALAIWQRRPGNFFLRNLVLFCGLLAIAFAAAWILRGWVYATLFAFNAFAGWNIFSLVLLNVRFSISLEMLEALRKRGGRAILSEFLTFNPDDANVEARLEMARRLDLISVTSHPADERTFSIRPKGYRLAGFISLVRKLFGIHSTG